MSASYNSPSRSPANSRFQLTGPGVNVSRLRSSSHKRLPEPHKRFQDYLVANSTIDLAYSILLEHTLVEREHSPAVVARCLALLKRYLLRYEPSEGTLQEIDRFCVSITTESDSNATHRLVPRSLLLSKQSGASSTSPNVSPLPVSDFASGGLLKSLNYVHSLVSQYIPRRSLQPAAFAGVASASRQSLPTLSSLLSRSFNSHLISPASVKEDPEIKEASALSLKEPSVSEEVDVIEDFGPWISSNSVGAETNRHH